MSVIKTAALALLFGTLVHTVAATSPHNDKCLLDILQHVPHMDQAFDHLNFYRGEKFTLFAPSKAASQTLVALLGSRGCLSISEDDLTDIVEASVIRGTKLRRFRLRSGRRSYAKSLPSGDDIVLDMGLKPGTWILDVTVLDGEREIIDAIDYVWQADINVCEQGVLHIIDEIIVPPVLLNRLQAAQQEPEKYCADPEDSHSIDAMRALTATARATLSQDNVNSTVIVPGSVNLDTPQGVAEAISSLEMGFNSTLTRQARTKGVAVDFDVPVTVNVKVETADGVDCLLNTTNIHVPVTVDVAIAVTVAGAPVGQGTGGTHYAACVDEPAPLWKACMGVRDVFDGHGGRETYQKGCEHGICIRKNQWFAKCVPEADAFEYAERGWDAAVLKCDDEHKSESPKAGSPKAGSATASAPKPGAGKLSAPKPGPSKSDSPKAGSPKSGSPKSDSHKS